MHRIIFILLGALSAWIFHQPFLLRAGTELQGGIIATQIISTGLYLPFLKMIITNIPVLTEKQADEKKINVVG